MFNFLLKQPQKVENTTPSLQLIDGLNLINRVLLTTKQWNNQFAKIQQTHYPESNSQQENSHQLTQQSFTQKLTSQIQNINTKRCELCKKQQSLDEFKRLSKCDHKYCYSCLNNYAISKIQGHQRVKCPQPSCLFELKLSSQVYKCLPEKIKLKYLRWINEMKAKKIDLSNSCVRCLQLLHTGPCTVEYSRQNIESAFQFRKCFKCKSQIRLSSGQKRLQCQQCHSVFCYCCGQVWPLTGEHFCVNSEKIFLLQKQVGQSTVNEHHHEGCCQDSQIQCLRNCGNCLGSCFYCKRCDFNICLGNVVMIPIRLLGTVIVLALYAILLIPVLIIILGWLFTGIITGVTCFTCEIIEKFSGCWQILAFLGYPILMLGGIGLGLVKTFPGFYEALQNVASFYGKALCELWIVCGPKQCCS